MSRFKGSKGIIILIILVVLVGGYYAYLSNRMGPTEEETEDPAALTQTQLVLSRDLETN